MSAANSDSPPHWAESLLIRLLKPRDRDSIPGDLLEEYREERLPATGRVCADFWYIRQVFSLASFRNFEGGPMKSSLMCLCFFTLAAAAWLGIMETVLRHPGFVLRIFGEMFFAAQSLATILFLIFRGHKPFRFLLMLGSVAILIIGGLAMIAVLKAAHFEGYILVIGAALILQGALTIAALAFVVDFRLPSSAD
jgi:hypothetical protein